MKVEGITLTQEMIDNIKFWQENPDSLQGSMKTFDKAISFIAHESEGNDQERAARGLQLISSLCYLKEKIGSFGKTEG